MSSVFSMVMLQAFYYGLVMVTTLFFCGAFLRGFFINYFKVRTSFGRLVLVKIRSPLRDYFARGWVEDGFLIYKIKRGFRDYDKIRLNIPKKGPSPFYKCLSVAWVDVDDEKHAICQTDYHVVTGYDAVKNNNLHTRALMKPTIASGQEKLILFAVIVVGLIALIGLFFAYQNAKDIQDLTTNLPAMLKGLSGVIRGGPTV